MEGEKYTILYETWYIICWLTASLSDSFLSLFLSFSSRRMLAEDYPKITSFFCCTSTPRVATHLRVLSASNLEKQDRTGGGR